MLLSLPCLTRMRAQLLQSCPSERSLWPFGLWLPGFFFLGILEARILECVARPSSRESSQTRDWTSVSCVSWIAGTFFSIELPGKIPLPECSSVQLVSHVWLFATPWTVACQASLSITNSWSLLRLIPIESVIIQPSHPLSSPSPAFSLSQHQGLFRWVNSSHPVAKVLKFQLQHQSFQWIFRTDFL